MTLETTQTKWSAEIVFHQLLVVQSVTPPWVVKQLNEDITSAVCLMLLRGGRDFLH